MATKIRIKKGLSLNLVGKAPKEQLTTSKKSSTYGLVPDDFQGVIPKVTVKVGDSVLAGDPLFHNKKIPEMKFTSPVSGEVVAVNRGEKRKVLSVEVRPTEEISYKEFPKYSDTMKKEEVKELLLDSGMWGFLKQRPYDIVALPTEFPKDIFITASFTAPLAPDFNYLLDGREEDLQIAINALAKLTEGNVYICHSPETTLPAFQAKNVHTYIIEGPHPAGNVGTQINKIAPVNKGEVVWTAKASDLFVIGRFLRTGKADFSRTIAVTGSDAQQLGYTTILGGCRINEVFDNKLCKKTEHERVINGDVLSGVQITKGRPFTSQNIDQITVIPEGDDVDEMFGWIAPRFQQFSVSRSYISWLQGKKKEYVFDARVKGGERAMIMSNEFYKVFPLDIFPEQLLKATIAFDIDKMEALGIYEVAPEDFALCEFVDSSKQELQYIIRKGLDLLYKEMN